MTESAASSPGRIFISYRREETAYPAGWLYDRLADHHGGSQIFKDVDSIQLGDDFVEVITTAVGSCDVLLALVGEEWLTITDADGRRRLDDPDDFVRVEIEAALTRNVRVIPILVDGATMPRADELPPSLARLVRRHALELSPARFEYDTGRLLRVLDRTLAEVRTVHGDAAAASTPAGRAADPSTTELPKAPEPARGGKKAAEQRARDQAEREDRDHSLAPSSPSLQAEPSGEQLSTATGAAEADAGTGVSAGEVEGVQGAAADHVVAVGEDGQRSAESTAWTADVSAITSPPAVPVGLTGSVTDGHVDLRWDPPVAGSAEVAKWEILRDGALTAEATSSPVTDTPLGPGAYRYTVRAVGANGRTSTESASYLARIPGPSRRWLVILAAVVALAGLLVWWVLRPTPARWEVVEGAFQESFSAAGVAEHQGSLWVVGGAGPGDQPLNQVRVFSPDTRRWREGPMLPIGVQHAALVSTGEQLFMLGGLNSSLETLDDVYRLDSPTGQWVEDGRSLPEPRFAGAAAWDGERLVFAGGNPQFRPGRGKPAADIWVLDSDGWVTFDEKLQQPREHLAAATDEKGMIWFVGGADISSGPYAVYDIVDVVSDDSVDLGPVIGTQVQGAAAIWTPETGICTFGGSTTPPNAGPSSAPVDLVDCLGDHDPDWPQLPQPRASAVAAVVGDTVYVVGGYGPEGSALESKDMVLALRFG